METELQNIQDKPTRDYLQTLNADDREELITLMKCYEAETLVELIISASDLNTEYAQDNLEYKELSVKLAKLGLKNYPL